MTWWNKKVETIEEPVPVVLQADVPDDLEAYIAKAKEAGLSEDSPIFTEVKLVQAIQDNNFSCYDYKTVAEYLCKVFRRESWGWYPLRSIDHSKTLWRPATLHAIHNDVNFTKITSHSGFMQSSFYTKPVPLPVLETIATLNKAVGPSLRCYVSDVVQVWADPFLLVMVYGGSRVFIVERWDEPSFRG
jgi:hypothetical protein